MSAQSQREAIFTTRVGKLIESLNECLCSPGLACAYAKGFKDECEAAAKHYKDLGWDASAQVYRGMQIPCSEETWEVSVSYREAK